MNACMFIIVLGMSLNAFITLIPSARLLIRSTGGDDAARWRSPARRLEVERRRGRAVARSGAPDPFAIIERVYLRDLRWHARTLRALLRRDGVDMVVRRPFHPEALRLVLLRRLRPG